MILEIARTVILGVSGGQAVRRIDRVLQRHCAEEPGDQRGSEDVTAAGGIQQVFHVGSGDLRRADRVARESLGPGSPSARGRSNRNPGCEK